MKKKSMLVVSMLILFALVFSLAACGDKGSTNKDKGFPTSKQWEQVGVKGTFTAKVTGDLKLSTVSDKGEISMKWEKSNEQSLDNTITWLKDQGYNSYLGQNAEKTTEEGGKIISYIAEKKLGETSTISIIGNNECEIVPMSYKIKTINQENKTMIAESYYITEDFSIMGVSFKKGDLYLDVYEGKTENPSYGLLEEWPISQIQNVFGESIPVYIGKSSGFQVIDASMGYMKTLQVQVFGASENEAEGYNNLLIQNGYRFNDDEEVCEKTLANGDIIQIYAYASMSYNPGTYEIVDIVSINIVLIKNSGVYKSWSLLDLSDFNSASIPVYSGGTSFDIEETSVNGFSVEEYEQIIEYLETLENMGMLDEEARVQLEEARKMLPLLLKVKAKIITVYGTNNMEASLYIEELEKANFVYGMKNIGDYQYQVEVSEDDGKALITIVMLPIELADEIIDGGGNDDPVIDEKLDWDDLPNSIKISLETGGITYSITKIGQDYLIDYFGQYIFLEYLNDTWVEYYYNIDFLTGEKSWIESGSTYNSLDNYATLSMFSELLFATDVTNYTKGVSEEIAGQECSVYSFTDDSTASYGLIGRIVKKINEQGFVLFMSQEYEINNEPYMSVTYQITLWDISVTTFEINRP